MRLDSWTVRFRAAAWALFALAVVAALLGWALADRDPTKLDGVLMWTAIGSGIGEASNIGKRHTFKAEAVGPE